ncbi:MAG: DUF1501 domain-containing protein [Pirellulales bacterium]|nr:DUF1501 domain-containing protein [Pirellulales bacterium]
MTHNNSTSHRRCQGSPRFASRRDFLWRSAGGLGGIALADLLAADGRLAAAHAPAPLTHGGCPHHPPRAKRVIQLFMSCGVSQVDSFDYKPALAKYHDQSVGSLPGIENLFFAKPGKWMKTPFAFQQYGETGKWCSEIFPHIAQHVDRLAFVHSMQSESNSHAPATFYMNTGFIRPGYPSAGAWGVYGLGSETQDLPAYVVMIDRGLPPGHNVNWSAGFLPAEYQGTLLRHEGDPILDLETPVAMTAEAERASRDVLARLNADHLAQNPGDGELAARISAYELAARMQLAVPETMNLNQETAETRRLYGLDHANPQVASFARNCLLARRLIERGVRYVSLFCGGPNMPTGKWNWDAHDNVEENHRRNAGICDQPIAALLTDLTRTGLWDDTLVTWTGEFGRTPFREGETPGRDHNPQGFTLWMAGGGVRGGASYGATDEMGYQAVDRPTSAHDFHATLMHLIGIDHERLTYYYNGRQQRLTDVHGQVIDEILA